LLQSAARITNEFLNGGLVVYTQGRMQKRRELNADTSGSYLPRDGRIVVLVNDNTASAGEILSGALQCLGRAEIVGERSYGKGSVQNLISVSGEDALLKLTTAYYYLQNGRLLHRKSDSKDWGVNPDIHVSMSPRQRNWLLRLRRRIDLLQEFDPEVHRLETKEMYETDLQLQTAVLLLKLRNLRNTVDKGTAVTARGDSG